MMRDDKFKFSKHKMLTSVLRVALYNLTDYKMSVFDEHITYKSVVQFLTLYPFHKKVFTNTIG
jgi:hypothetical protein